MKIYKVLFIAYYFPPKGLSGVQRPLKFAKYFPEFNWYPTVLTSGAGAYYAYDHEMLDEIDTSKVKVVRVEGKEINARIKRAGKVKMPAEWFRKTLSFISSIFFVPDNKKPWAKAAFGKAIELLSEEHYDLIFVTAPPFSSVSMAVDLKKRFNIPLVIDYQDLWFGYQFAYYPTPMHKEYIYRKEYAALKTADKITVTNRKIKETLIEVYKFIKHEDILIVPHGYDPSDIVKASARKKASDKMMLTYSGLFYEFITPKFFLKAFKVLALERPDIAANIELHFIGFLRDENKRLIKNLGIQNYVIEHGYLSHSAALEKVMMSDVLWMMVGYGRNAHTISSSKLYEYFGTEKPIMGFLPDGALKSALQEYEAAYVCEPEDIKSIKKLIIDAYTQFREKALPKPNSDVVEKYNRVIITEQLTKELQFVARERI